MFKKNYYFMLGDNWMNSNDSRHWGLLPEDFIVGKSLFVCYSVDSETKRLRYGRIGKNYKAWRYANKIFVLGASICFRRMREDK